MVIKSTKDRFYVGGKLWKTYFKKFAVYWQNTSTERELQRALELTLRNTIIGAGFVEKDFGITHHLNKSIRERDWYWKYTSVILVKRLSKTLMK